MGSCKESVTSYYFEHRLCDPPTAFARKVRPRMKGVGLRAPKAATTKAAVQVGLLAENSK